MNIEFSLIIPVKEFNEFLDESVPIIQNLQPDNWELIILPDEPSDNKWQEDPRIKIVPSGRMGPGAKRDIGASVAAGKYLVFLDDDSYPSSQLLAKIEVAFESELNCIAVGGPAVTPPGAGLFERLSGAFYESKFSGSDRRRYLAVGGRANVEDWPSVNLTIRKDVFNGIGGFGSTFWPGEDTYLCNKIIEAGLSIQYDPEVVMFHHRRKSLSGHLRQIKGYGLHRGNFARHFKGNSRQARYFIPSIFTVLVLVSPFILFTKLSFLYQALVFLIATYTLGIFFTTLAVRKSHGGSAALIFPVYVFLSHLTYGFAFIRGFLANQLIKSKLR